MKIIWLKTRQAISFFSQWKYRNYAILFTFFILWVALLNPNNISTQYKLFKELSELRSLKKYYEENININEKEVQRFRSDLHFVETYGREQYLMKKDNEDIFLLVE